MGDRAVPRVVTDEHGLLPEHTQQHRAQHVRIKSIAFTDNAIHHRRKQSDEASAELGVVDVIRVKLILEPGDERAERGDVRRRVGRRRGCHRVARRGCQMILWRFALVVVDKGSHSVRVERLGRLAVRAVVRAKGIGHVASGVLYQRDGSARVPRDPMRDVVDGIVDDDPRVFFRGMARDVRGGVVVGRWCVHVRGALGVSGHGVSGRCRLA